MIKRLVVLLLALASLAAAQGVRKDDVAYRIINTSSGQLLTVIPNATITVCTATGVGAPCSPLATIYTNASLATPAPNPFTADVFGNYGFWAPPGTYFVSITQPGAPNGTITYTLSPMVPTSANQIYVNGISYPNTAAGINSADAVLGASPGTIFVTFGGNYCDATVLLSNNHVLVFSPGTYALNIAGADSTTANVSWGVTGAGANQTVLQSCPGAKDVVTSQNFSTFTGGTSNFGVFRPTITDVKIDGNSSGGATGFGVRLYSKAPLIRDAIVVNCAQDCIYGEYGGSATEATEAADIEGQVINTKIITAVGNGITNKGAFREIHGPVIFDTTGWGIDTFTALEVVDGANIFAGSATTGGIKTETSGAVVSLSGSINGGKWGVYVGPSAAGPMAISGTLGAASSLSGSAGLEVHSSNITFNGNINGAQNGIILSSASAFDTFVGSLSGNTVTGIGGVSGGFNIFRMAVLAPGGATDYSATFSATTDQLYITASGGTNHGITQQSPSGTFILGANSNPVVFPTGTLGAFAEKVLTSGNPSDSVIQYVETGAGCQTATTVGTSCTTSLNWGHNFADTNYAVFCTPISITSGAGVMVVTNRTNSGLTITTINVIAGTAAQFGAFDCLGIHY